MTLARFEIFRTTVEQGSLSKAAAALDLTQSAVSHAIAGLETDFGFTLLTRSRSGINLTPNGKQMLNYIHEILKLNEQMIQEAGRMSGLETGIVRIGTFPSVSVQLMPKIIKQFAEDYPKIEIKLFEGDYDDISKWILEGWIDLGFLSLPTLKSFDVLPIKKDRLMCILPESHSMCQKEAIQISEISKEPFIMPKHTIDNDVRRIFKLHKTKPNIYYEIEEDQAIISMVQHGLGISILPEMSLFGLPDSVRTLPLTGDFYRTIGICATSLNHLSPGGKKLIEITKRLIDENPPRA